MRRRLFSRKETAGPAAGGYFVLGVEHILFGIDHLLFVLALVLIVRGVGLLVKTITAFTVAHSITLALATLGVVHVPSAPVEAVIALSIVFVASEILRSRRGERGLTERAPWLVAGTFGLLHGFGFAGALSQVGLPANDIPLALLFFNLGVEAGQLAFVVVALGVIALLRRVRAAGMGADPSALRHWQRRDVLGHRTHRRHLVKPLSLTPTSTLIQTMKTKALVTTIATLLAISFTAFAAEEHHHRHRHARQGQSRRGVQETPLFALRRSQISRRARSSATRTCTPASRWMPARSAAGLNPRDAYRFARGEQIMASSGQPAKLSRPLDFLVVADHSDNMGFFPDLFAGKPEMLADPTGRKWYDMIQSGKGARGRARHHRQLFPGHVSRRS